MPSTQVLLTVGDAADSRRAALVWVGLAALLGLLSSALLSSLLGLERAAFVLGHSSAALALTLVYGARSGRLTPALIRRGWVQGVVGGLALGGLLVRGVLLQPPSTAPEGWGVALALGWYGAVYGLADALLLNVLPVVMVAHRGRRRARAVPALMASLIVTAAYHVGFREYQGERLRQPLVGNALMTAGYLVTGNPLTPILAHVIMHGAAVVHGMETTYQLPPHRPAMKSPLSVPS